jgi:hypothetical protein
MKRACFFVIGVFLLSVILTGCDFPAGKSTQHTFLQNREDVVKVEICTNDTFKILHSGETPYSLSPLYVLSEEEIDSLWESLLAFPAYEVRYVSTGCGDLLFVVSYANGEQELIGYGEIGVINAEGLFDSYRNHRFWDGPLMSELFAQYVSPKTLKETSESFRAYYELP